MTRPPPSSSRWTAGGRGPRAPPRPGGAGGGWGCGGLPGRRISIEYALIRDINDQPWRADLLGRLLAGHLAHVNLIPLNPTPGSKWTASRPGVQEEFVRRVADHGVAG